VTVSRSVCGPFASVRVSTPCQSTVPVFVTVTTGVPSIVSAQVFDVPHGALVFMPTDIVPLAVAPASGYVNSAVNDAVLPFATVTVRVAVAVAPAASVTTSFSV